MKHRLPCLLILLLTLCQPGCVVLDVVEGFRQFGGKPPSRYGRWRAEQMDRQPHP